jgi:hypothetical protein
VFKVEILVNMTQVSDVAPGPLVHEVIALGLRKISLIISFLHFFFSFVFSGVHSKLLSHTKIQVKFKFGFDPLIFRSRESLRWPIAICFRPSSSVNFWTFWASSLGPLNQFQPDLACSIYWWRGIKIVNFMVPAPRGLGRGTNYPKVTNFQKSSSLQPHLWRKKWMHGDGEQKGPYQSCEIYNPRGSSFAPRAGSNMIYGSFKIWTF